MNYNVDYFIKKFEAIPEEMWCIDIQDNGSGQRCAYGWCGNKDFNTMLGLVNNGAETIEGIALTNLFLSLGVISKFSPAIINNGKCCYYQQPTPKQRILSALYDIKKMQDGDPENKANDAVEPRHDFKPITFTKIQEAIPVQSEN